jgi:hypothetical protein
MMEVGLANSGGMMSSSPLVSGPMVVVFARRRARNGKGLEDRYLDYLLDIEASTKKSSL